MFSNFPDQVFGQPFEIDGVWYHEDPNGDLYPITGFEQTARDLSYLVTGSSSGSNTSSSVTPASRPAPVTPPPSLLDSLGGMLNSAYGAVREKLVWTPASLEAGMSTLHQRLVGFQENRGFFELSEQQTQLESIFRESQRMLDGALANEAENREIVGSVKAQYDLVRCCYQDVLEEVLSAISLKISYAGYDGKALEAVASQLEKWQVDLQAAGLGDTDLAQRGQGEMQSLRQYIAILGEMEQAEVPGPVSQVTPLPGSSAVYSTTELWGFYDRIHEQFKSCKVLSWEQRYQILPELQADAEALQKILREIMFGKDRLEEDLQQLLREIKLAQVAMVPKQAASSS